MSAAEFRSFVNEPPPATPVSICVPVLNRYDQLRLLIQSLAPSTLRPQRIVVIDNGRDMAALRHATDACAELPWNPKLDLVVPAAPLGLAEAWNWFIDNVPGDRVITNDDIQFAAGSLQAMVDERAPFVSCTYGFSCFLLRDECVRLVGKFDETISPGYAYFEDRDYYRRMKVAAIADKVVQCGVVHAHSMTHKALTPEQMETHHRKFVIAQENYLRKWGELPHDVARQAAPAEEDDGA